MEFCRGSRGSRPRPPLKLLEKVPLVRCQLPRPRRPGPVALRYGQHQSSPDRHPRQPRRPGIVQDRHPLPSQCLDVHPRFLADHAMPPQLRLAPLAFAAEASHRTSSPAEPHPGVVHFSMFLLDHYYVFIDSISGPDREHSTRSQPGTASE